MKKWSSGALAGERYRVIVTTDIGGSDPDDFQSMAHYLLYADMFDTEGLISSPWGAGTKQDILTVIDAYEKDYPNLKRFSDTYPEPDALRAMTKQGVIETAPYSGYRTPTEASEWIIRCAEKEDPRPLYLLMWGLLEDLAQALHDAPHIADKLRVYYIGGPNKKWGPNAYEYIRENFPDLWMIENNSTYRGWFVGGDQEGDLGNHSFVEKYVAGHGALGEYFAKHLGGTIKMGDTPSVVYLLRGTPEDPTQDSWGGSFVPTRYMEQKTFCRNTTMEDTIQVFGVLELVYRGPVREDLPRDVPAFFLRTKDQDFPGFYTGNGEYKIRFVPKEVSDWTYVIHSDIPELDGQSGSFRSTPEEAGTREKGPLTHWWTDRLEEEWAEGPHKGAKTVSQWRKEFLMDFAARYDRCQGDGE